MKRFLKKIQKSLITAIIDDWADWKYIEK